MTTYSFNRSLIGKVEIDSFCRVIGDIHFFTEMFIEKFSMFHTHFVKIA